MASSEIRYFRWHGGAGSRGLLAYVIQRCELPLWRSMVRLRA